MGALWVFDLAAMGGRRIVSRVGGSSLCRSKPPVGPCICKPNTSDKLGFGRFRPNEAAKIFTPPPSHHPCLFNRRQDQVPAVPCLSCIERLRRQTSTRWSLVPRPRSTLRRNSQGVTCPVPCPVACPVIVGVTSGVSLLFAAAPASAPASAPDCRLFFRLLSYITAVVIISTSRKKS